MSNKNEFSLYCFSLIICRNSKGKWLCVKESRNRGWWIPGGKLDHGDDFYSAALRETREEAGIDIDIKGVLRVEENFYGSEGRLRVIFYAEPKNQDQIPKQKADIESEKAEFLTLKEIENLVKNPTKNDFIRGDEIYCYPNYIENGGKIFQIELLTQEGKDLQLFKMFNSFQEKESKSLKECNKLNHTQEDLYNIIFNNSVEQIKELLLNGLSPDTIINDKEWTILLLAIQYQKAEICKLLILSGADLSLTTHKDRNCLHFAVQKSIENNDNNDNSRILKMVLLELLGLDNLNKRKKIINKQDIEGCTPLHFISEVFLVLKQKNINFQKDDFQKEINKLIDIGADDTIKNKKGMTCYDVFNS